MPSSLPEYHAYLLRLWRTGRDGPWRVSVEDARTGERTGFDTVESACHFLRALACPTEAEALALSMVAGPTDRQAPGAPPTGPPDRPQPEATQSGDRSSPGEQDG
jgi:hypothetical protein